MVPVSTVANGQDRMGMDLYNLTKCVYDQDLALFGNMDLTYKRVLHQEAGADNPII